MTNTIVGWILDVYIENDEAILWVKKEDGSAIRLIDQYQPTLYILPTSERDGAELYQILSSLPIVHDIKWEYKFTDISNQDKRKLLVVTTISIFHYNKLLRILENPILGQRTRQLFNTRITHLQKYLFARLKVQPVVKVRIEI
jgi:hypothetical protein